MPETTTPMSTDAFLFVLGSLLAVLASIVVAMVTLRVEQKRRLDERQRWADERKDRALEREGEQQRWQEQSTRRWDEQRHQAYAHYLAELDRLRRKILGFAGIRLDPGPVSDWDDLLSSGRDFDDQRVPAEMLMSPSARQESGRVRTPSDTMLQGGSRC